MAHPIRRTDRAILEEEALKLLEQATFGILSTVGNDGEPYGCPLNFCLSEDKTRIFFHGAASGRKLDNIRSHPRCHFVAFPESRIIGEALTTEYSSVMVEGEITEITDESRKTAAACRLAERFSPGFDPSGYAKATAKSYTVLEMRIEDLSGKRNGPLTDAKIEEKRRHVMNM